MIRARRLRDPQQFNLYTYVRNNPLAFTDPDGRDLQRGTSEDQKRIRKALVEIAKRAEGRKFLNRLNDVSAQIVLNIGKDLKDSSGKEAYGKTSAKRPDGSNADIVRTRSDGQVVDVRTDAPVTVSVDFKKADADRKFNEAAIGSGLSPKYLGVPTSDAQLQGHELAHAEAQLFGTNSSEGAADARIDDILDSPEDKNLTKDAESFVDNILLPKGEEKNRAPNPK